ncbi:hypothetical protein NTH51_002230 [Vibrio fluvialis]|nr:hypothetical protein [Vibrio fluvialis]
METQIEMTKWQCHKKVWALQIKEVSHNENPDKTGISGTSSYGATLSFVDERYAPIKVNADYVNKHKPQDGGYYVVYEGGYQSFSPKDAFESGYSEIK